MTKQTKQAVALLLASIVALGVGAARAPSSQRFAGFTGFSPPNVGTTAIGGSGGAGTVTSVADSGAGDFTIANGTTAATIAAVFGSGHIQKAISGGGVANKAVTDVNASTGVATVAFFVNAVGATADLVLTNNSIDVDETKVQHRVSGGGVANKAITDIAQNGVATVAFFVNAATANKLLSVASNAVGIDDSAAMRGGSVTYSGSNPVWSTDVYRLGQQSYCWWDELDTSSGTVGTHLQEAGANSPTFTIASGSDQHPGVWTCSTAAAATAACSFQSGAVNFSLSATDITTVRWIFSTRTLDDGTDTYALEAGFGDVTGSAQVDGCGFLYTKTTAVMGSGTSADWQIFCSANSLRTTAILDGTTTDTVLSVVAVGDMSALTGTTYDAMVSCTTSRCDFCLGDTDADSYCHAGSTGHVGSACASGCSMAATRIPGSGTTTNGSQLGARITIAKLAGTTAARIMDVDGGGVCRPFSTPR